MTDSSSEKSKERSETNLEKISNNVEITDPGETKIDPLTVIKETEAGFEEKKAIALGLGLLATDKIKETFANILHSSKTENQDEGNHSYFRAKSFTPFRGLDSGIEGKIGDYVEDWAKNPKDEKHDTAHIIKAHYDFIKHKGEDLVEASKETLINTAHHIQDTASEDANEIKDFITTVEKNANIFINRITESKKHGLK